MTDLNPHSVLAPSSPRHTPSDNQMRPRPSPPYPVGGEDADVLAPRPRPGLRILAETIAETLPLLADAKTRCCPHGVDWRNCHQHNGHVIAGEVIKETE